MKLLSARRELTEDITRRKGKNIFDYWSGTVVMSAIELAFIFSKKNPKQPLMKNYCLWKSYLKEDIVQECIKNFRFESNKIGIKKIPFFLLKIQLEPILFLMTFLLNGIGYRFERK